MKDPFVIQIGKIKNSKINDYSKNKFEGDIFLGHTEKDSLRPSIGSNGINKFFILVIIGLSVLFLRSFSLQILKGDYYRGVAEGNRIRIQPVKADRGIIYDRNKKPLVKNIPRFSLSIIPADLPKDENARWEVLYKLSKILETEAGLKDSDTFEDTTKNKILENLINLEKLIKETPSYSYQPLLINNNVDYQTTLILKMESENLPGIVLGVESRRDYLEGVEFSHLLGYLSKINPEEFEKNKEEYLINDYLGKTGIEFIYEKELKGVDGKKNIEVDSLGKEKRIISTKPPMGGKNLILAIDADLQKILTSSLKDIKPARAAIVALNPQNGEILAMISYPDFDNNLFSQGISQENYQRLIEDNNKPLLFRPISGEYPIGSTIKLIISSAALEEKIINSKTKVLSAGGIRIGQWFFGDWKAGGHGWTDVKKALAESVNTFFYYIGGGYQEFEGLGLKKIGKYAQLFGLNKKTGIDLPNESSGFFPSAEWKEEVKNEVWYIGDTYHLSIGQGDVLATPLQVANFTAIVANGGIFYKPHIVKEIIDPEKDSPREIPQSGNFAHSEIISRGKKLKIESEIIRQDFISPENIKIVREGMREAVISGSARSLANLPVKAAGKTGTAEVGGDQETHAWFTCFAPYENPEIVITVLVENGGEGSSVALPIAKKALEWYFR